MGLLDGMQQQPQAPQGGLLGGMMAQGGGQPPAQGQDVAKSLQMAMQLAQNPTQQTAQQIVMQMRQTGMQGADEMVKIFDQAGGDPQALGKIAEIIIQQLGGK